MQRSQNPLDGTSQDIFHLCSALERFFLYHPIRKTPCIHLLNYLELLFQSARTRICIFREPSDNFVQSRRSVTELIVLSTFRTCSLYAAFLQKFTDALNTHQEEFLAEECVCLDLGGKRLYILLSRVYPETGTVSIRRNNSNEAYYRLTVLFRKLKEDQQHWGLNIRQSMYNCLDSLQNDYGWMARYSPCEQAESATGNIVALPLVQSSQKENEEVNARLKALRYWIESAYTLLQDTSLSEIADPLNSQQQLPFGNHFFFMRVNVVPEGRKCLKGCEDFEVKMVLPEKQCEQLSNYYHQHQYDTCQWSVGDGKCSISGMGDCVAKPYWDSSNNIDETEIVQHYQPLWDRVEEKTLSSSSKASAAFSCYSVIFDRRHERLFDEGERGRVNQFDERDRIAACVSLRMMPVKTPPPQVEDLLPQVMFVPLYAGGEPLVVISTIVNTLPSVRADINLTEWRRSFRFADYALEQLSDRLQESLKRIYVEEAVNLLQKRFIASDMFHQEHESETDAEQRCEEQLLSNVQEDLDFLAKSLPYKQIMLAKSYQYVIKKHRRCGIFTTPWGGLWKVSLADNSSWRNKGGSIDSEYIRHEFDSCMQRVTAYREKERKRQLDTLLAHYAESGHHPPSPKEDK